MPSRKSPSNKTNFNLFLFLGLIVLGLAAYFLYQVKTDLAKSPNELETQAFVDRILQSNGLFDANAKDAVYDNAAITPPEKLADQGSPAVLNANITPSGQEKWIEVNLSQQRLYAHEGDRVVASFLVSTGKKKTPTITGEYRVWIKLRYTTMKGGSKARGDYYNLPNVPYVMYFYQGYGLHGTYWHSNFGTPMSHGCINVKTEEMAFLYNWAGPEMPIGKSVIKSSPDNPGIRVVIHS